MMLKLMREVEELRKREYERAAEQHGPTFHSTHEAYAVILEEIEEAETERRRLAEMNRSLWERTKKDELDGCNDLLCAMIQTAQQAAAEYIQVAAMCEKATKLYNETM